MSIINYARMKVSSKSSIVDPFIVGVRFNPSIFETHFLTDEFHTCNWSVSTNLTFSLADTILVMHV